MNPRQVSEAIKAVSDARGISYEEGQRSYNTVKAMQKAMVKEESQIPADSKHWGSTAQLKYGSVMALNVPSQYKADPAFYAIAAPAGGQAGPKHYDISPVVSKVVDPVALENHAATHDASGFIYRHFNKGGGYNYAGGLWFNGLALSGQASGLKFWSRIQEEYASRVRPRNNPDT